jgi:CRISPR/Cas system CSM-associated protein Csm3 (group 7 of RAMP superfamily)
MEIEVTLTFETPVNIGSGAQVSTFADRAMIKDYGGWPYIPASTLKGRLRHAIEQLLVGVGQCVCRSPLPDAMCKTDPCPVCQLMGSPWVEGTLFFENLPLTGPQAIIEARQSTSHPRTETRTGVSLARRRKVAAEGLLYTTELFRPGVELVFSGTIRGQMIPGQAALVVAGLKSIPALGGGKTGGLGWCRIETTVRRRGEDGWETLDEATLREELAAWH